MTKLNQVLAAAKGIKSRAGQRLTAAYHAYQNEDALSGLSREYKPIDELGEKLPGEEKLVLVNARDLIAEVTAQLTEIIDIEATKNEGNTDARADIVVDGEDQPLARDVPVTTLLSLEKALTDLHTFVAKLPVLDPREAWDYDEQAGLYRSKVAETTRSKKVPRNHIKYEATTEHPAQVEMYFEDQIVGVWSTTKFSGAVKADDKRAMLLRVEALQKAVKFAREEANTSEVSNQKLAGNLLDYVFPSS